MHGEYILANAMAVVTTPIIETHQISKWTMMQETLMVVMSCYLTWRYIGSSLGMRLWFVQTAANMPQEGMELWQKDTEIWNVSFLNATTMVAGTKDGHGAQPAKRNSTGQM
jgi:hypothetical protein